MSEKWVGRTPTNSNWQGRKGVSFLTTEALDFLMTEDNNYLITEDSIYNTWVARPII